MTEQTLYEQLVKEITDRYPSFSVRYKNESTLMKVLGVIVWPVNTRFMTGFTTTLGSTVYFPNREFVSKDYASAFDTLAHEFVHIYDASRSGRIPFLARWCMPQLIAVAAVVAILNLWALVILAALLPWPSPWRCAIEGRGYAMNVATEFWRTGKLDPATRKWIASEFTGPGYYLMSWSASESDARVDAWLTRLRAGTLPEDDSLPYQLVKDLLTTTGKLVPPLKES